MRLLSIASLFLVSCGAFSGWLVCHRLPSVLGSNEQGLRNEAFPFERKPDKAFEVSDAAWFLVPWLYGDFDLHMDVELSEGMELDILLRQVEPRNVGDQFLQFHGRFSVLRLSSKADAPGWRTREQALFGPHDGGVELAPGYVATVWVQARGRLLRANVAGKWQPWFLADDEYGMTTLVARGGKAALHNLVIESRGQQRAWLWSAWWWAGLGALGAAMLVAIGHARGECPIWFLTAGPLLLGSAWLFAGVGSPELSLPPPLALLQILAAALATTLASQRSVRWPWLLALLASALLLVWNADRQLRHDGRALDPVFGPHSGETVSEALAQRVRGPSHVGVHTVGPAAHRVFLLGGKLLYDRATPAEHLESLLSGQLRAGLLVPVDVPCLPTVDGHSQQQWRLFSGFFTGYRPNVLVFGVPRDEAAVDEATGVPRSDPSALDATLHLAQQYCIANACGLVVFTEAGLPEELSAVLEKAAATGIPLVRAEEGETPAVIAKKLAAAILPLLKAR
ncbi:MAG TPA: hypothetical protein VFD82_04520 [Planctomycetota bacterium]|nr:hypothetical protein [Planctomycetota bacterium]